MNNNIVKIFPKCYYTKDNVCNEMLEKFEQFVKFNIKKIPRSLNFSVDTSHSYNSELHRFKTFIPLAEEIMESAKDFMISYGHDPMRSSHAFIQTMWFNTSNKNDFLFPHNHPGSFISGAYYVKTTPENHIIFHDNEKNFYEDVLNNTELGTTTHPVKCEPGRLLLFPSTLQHSTPIQKQEGEKIVISFNIVLENKKR
jgi:uncharacterized protein (TIGR02466 family)